ncbi:RidA family protein [Mycobacterium sp. NPDC003449]
MIDRRWPDDVYVREIPGCGRKLYAQAVAATGTRIVEVAGSMSFTADNTFVGEGDVAAQTAQVLDVIGRSLRSCGAAMSDVVRTTTYVTDIEAYLRDGHSLWLSAFGDDLPVSTCIQVVRFTEPRALIEMEARAVVP